jgi:LSD1 subclass zinc finger protein
MQTFTCPSCGAEIEYAGGGRTIRCTYCGTVVEVPPSLWQPVEQARIAGQAKKWLIIFLVVTVGLPTCLGLVGTIAGVGGGLLAGIIPFVLSLLRP